ncbi:MAG: ComEC/Rec2 family competence protein [Actinomycetota bacterium]
MAAAFWAGLLLSSWIDPRLGVPLVVVPLGALVAAVFARRRRAPHSSSLLVRAGLAIEPPEPANARERVLLAAGFPTEPVRAHVLTGPARLAAILIGVVVAGTGWGAARIQPPDLGPLEGRYVRFAGAALSDLHQYDWGSGIEVGLESLWLDGRAWRVDSRAWVSGGIDGIGAEAGERVRGEGRLEAVTGDGFGEYLSSRGVEVSIGASDLRVAPGGVSPPMAAANAARRGLRTGLSRVMPPKEAGLLLGLAIGETSDLDPEVEEDFRASGLSHLLAVSGSNVATFLVPLLAVAAALGAGPRTRAAAGAAGVLFFALMTRWEPSVLRAGVMAGIALIAIGAGRPRSTGPALGAAVLLLLVADPRLASSVGFELSVAATAGIVLLASPIAGRLTALPRVLALAVAATVAAQAAVTPLLLLRFGVVPGATLLANVLAFPAVGPSLLLGVSAAMLGILLPPIGSIVGRLATFPVDYLIGVADGTARFPLPSLTSEGLVVPILLATLVALAAWRLRRGRRPAVAIAAAVLVTAAAWSVPLRGAGESLTATFLDVGQGDAALVRSPGGATVLVDAGPDEQDLAVDLARLGVRRIDLAVATHAHADHVAGFPAVLARFPVSLLLDPGCPGDSPVYARYLRAVEDEAVKVEHPRGGDRYAVGDLSVEVLGPDGCSPAGEPNDDSIVLSISLGDDTILFPGDAEVPSQQDMLEDGDAIEADVLKVPHHGGDTSDPLFLEATGASVAIVSSGTNTYGHPSPRVLELLRASGMSIYRTDLDGEVAVRFTAEGDVVVGSEAS